MNATAKIAVISWQRAIILQGLIIVFVTMV